VGTFSSWIHLVIKDINVKAPDGFAWTSHSLRGGATTAAYAIGDTRQKILKVFGGRAKQSRVVLDYIDPTTAPTTGDWYFFGWLTPWGGQPQNYPPFGDMMANRSPHCFVIGHTKKL
jgi:hypothetical protein